MSDADLQRLAGDRSGSLLNRGRGYPGGFTCGVLLYLIAVIVWVLGLVFWTAFVHSRIVWVEAPFLSASSVPYYNYPLVMPPTDTSLAEVYSLDWFIYQSDLLLFFVAVYLVGSLIFALVQQIRSLNSLGLSIVVTLVVALQLAKSVYFSLYWFGASTSFSCERYPFCVNRNPAEPPDSADTTFLVHIYLTYAYTLLSLVLYGLPSVYKSASIHTLRVGAKCPGCGDKVPDARSLEEGQQRSSTKKGGGDVRSRRSSKSRASAHKQAAAASAAAVPAADGPSREIPDITFH